MGRKETESEWKEDTFIDKDTLDKELVFHGEIFEKWSVRLADAIEERDLKKSDIEIKKAELDKKIRSDPAEFGLKEKPTETSISNAILLDEEIQELNKEFINCVRNVNILTSAKEDMHNKRKRIEKLVELYLGSYWAEPKLNKENKNSLNSRMKRRKI